MHVPQLLDIEITQVLCRLVRQKEITAARAEQALQDPADLLKMARSHGHRATIELVAD